MIAFFDLLSHLRCIDLVTTLGKRFFAVTSTGITFNIMLHNSLLLQSNGMGKHTPPKVLDSHSVHEVSVLAERLRQRVSQAIRIKHYSYHTCQVLYT